MNDDISTAISPGKFILLGEHAVVYGKPAVALAIDMSFSCSVSAGEYNSLNGVPIDLSRHPHIQCILSRLNVNVFMPFASSVPQLKLKMPIGVNTYFLLFNSTSS